MRAVFFLFVLYPREWTVFDTENVGMRCLAIRGSTGTILAGLQVRVC